MTSTMSTWRSSQLSYNPTNRNIIPWIYGLRKGFVEIFLETGRRDAPPGHETLLNRVGQQRDGTGALDGLGQLALMLGAVAGYTTGQDLAAFVDVAMQPVRVLVIDVYDLADAEVTHLTARTATSTAVRTGFPFAAIFRHMYILLK